MQYKAIGFDWGGVINGKPGKYFGQAAAELLGVTHDEYLRAYFQNNKKINRGEISWQELWTLVLNELRCPEKLPDIINLSKKYSEVKINNEIIDLIDNLRKNGYKVGLLSNNTHEKAAVMRSLDIDKHFDVFHVSAETGYVKPEKEAFKHLSDELDVKLHELIFIDDSEKSLSTSQECGYTPILYDNYQQLKAELKYFEINTGTMNKGNRV